MASEEKLISASELYEKVRILKDGACFYAPIYEGFMKMIAEAPAVDAVPVVHGEWIPILSWKFGYRCSECNRMIVDKTNFCPNCGAKMGDV